MITKAQAMALAYGQSVYNHGQTKTYRCRVSGKCQTWITRPEEFRIPVKCGLYESYAITHENAAEWSLSAERE